ncbi:MAG: hypothetical protein AB4042_02275 [Leptolyngbyaceae cyanobacterium]
MSYEAGLAAFQQNKFEDAIAYLSAYCQECDASESVTSQKYMQAHRGIIKCYQQSNQLDQAIAHCQGLADTKNTALNIWVDRNLPKLEAAAEKAKQQAEQADQIDESTVVEQMPSQQEQDNEVLLHQGIKAYKDMKRDRAIKLLEEYTEVCTKLASRNYMNAQMTLIKAYREVKDFEKAVARCEALATSENFALKSWATKALPKLQENLAEINPPPDPDTDVAEATEATPANPVTPVATTPISTPAAGRTSAPAGFKQPSVSSYIFNATAHGPANLQRVEPPPHLLALCSSSPARPLTTAPVVQPGEISDSMIDGLAIVPRRTH